MKMERGFLYFTVFFCGAAVLVVELISARQLSPFYGTSLAVWTAVIGITLAALSLGYAVGGWFGDRMFAQQRGMIGLAMILAVSAIGCGLLPLTGPRIMLFVQGAGLIGGVLLSTLLMLLPALGALGMVGPFVIRLLTREVDQAGRVAGRVFAVSTVGSILAAMITGFYLAPFLGVRASYLLVACVLGLLAITATCLARRSPLVVAAVAVILGLVMGPAAASLHRPLPVQFDSYTLVEIVEGGAYGEIKILDQKRSDGTWRILMFDGLFQSGMDLANNTSMYPYIHVVAAGLSILPAGSRIVVVGIGGGLLPSMLIQMGYEVIAVDINPQMPQVARDWFNMPEEVQVVIEDGRHYVERLAPASVDAIVIDAFTGDREPVHLMTREAFEACRKALRPHGLLVLNPLMHTSGSGASAYAGLIHTVERAGFKPEAVAAEPDERWHNTLVFAHADTRPWIKGFRREPLLKLGLETGSIALRDYYLALNHPVSPEPFDHLPLYTDDRSALDYLNREWNQGMRRMMINEVKRAMVY